MNTSNQTQSVLVWDFPVRVFHWLLVITFVGAWITSESEALQIIHYGFGYSACTLVLFRIVWGIVGPRYARFTQFIEGPTGMIRHIKLVLAGCQPSSLGHNPVGGVAIICLMGLMLLLGLTGYWHVKAFMEDVISNAHEALASLALGIVVIHVAATIVMSFLQKENLIKSMITGEKQGLPDQAIRDPMYLIGIGLALIWAASFFLVVSGYLPGLTQ